MNLYRLALEIIHRERERPLPTNRHDPRHRSHALVRRRAGVQWIWIESMQFRSADGPLVTVKRPSLTVTVWVPPTYVS